MNNFPSKAVDEIIEDCQVLLEGVIYYSFQRNQITKQKPSLSSLSIEKWRQQCIK
jgi:hypothetical protein